MSTGEGEGRTMKLAVFVVFGAPATGKTTLLQRLKKEPSQGKLYYATIDEPTHEPHIVDLLRQMYNETEAVVHAGNSVAYRVQSEIMSERARLYRDFTDAGKAMTEMWAAVRAGAETLVVVCDGHLLTDDKLYAGSKAASGQISADQMHMYETHKAVFLREMHGSFARPLAFVELALDDESGETHARRISERDSIAEAGVPASVFARLAHYSRKTAEDLTREDFSTYRISTDGCDPDAVQGIFAAIVQAKLAASAPKLAYIFEKSLLPKEITA